jgi:hypothetical protein
VKKRGEQIIDMIENDEGGVGNIYNYNKTNHIKIKKLNKLTKE